MGAPSTRTIARIFLTVAALAALLYFLYLIRSVIELLLIAVFLAVALGPAVDFFSRRGLRRAPAILVVYVLIASSIVGVGLLVVPPIVNQVQDLADNIPHYIDDLRKNKTVRKYDQRYHIGDKLKKEATKLPAKLGDAASTLQSVTVGVFSAIVKLVTVLTMTFFLLLEGGDLFRLMLARAPPERAQRIRKVSGDVYRAVAGYVAGNLLISVIAGTITYITLSILGVPFAVPLAVLMAFLDLIPLVGATLGAIIIGIVTAFHDFPTATIVWVVVAIVYQQVENNVIQPVVYRRTVDVRPLFVIVAILIGSELLGVLGALVAIPVAAAVQIVVRDVIPWGRPPEPPAPPAEPEPEPEPAPA
jgi:predicted PurR-regulated permease PerM